MLEHVWWTAHAARWFPGWMWFQALAVVVGALLIVRGGGQRLFVPYAVGAVLAAAGAIALGSFEAWMAWATASGARGAMPELEIAGFGAIAGLVLGHVLASRARGITAGRALDALAAPMGAMIAIARTGCFFAGCDFGAPTTQPWGLAYPPFTPAFRAQVDAGLIQASAARTLAVHPTQLYEAGIGLVVVAAALASGRPLRQGDRFAAAALTYAAGRLVVDLARGDLARGGALGLTTTQALALALTGLTGAVLAWRFSAAAPPATPPATLSGGRRSG